VDGGRGAHRLRTTKSGRIVYIKYLGEDGTSSRIEATVWTAPD
jgi:hypothetical protein